MCKLDLYVCGLIYFCTVGFSDICVSSIYIYAARFIFVRLD